MMWCNPLTRGMRSPLFYGFDALVPLGRLLALAGLVLILSAYGCDAGHGFVKNDFGWILSSRDLSLSWMPRPVFQAGRLQSVLLSTTRSSACGRLVTASRIWGCSWAVRC